MNPKLAISAATICTTLALVLLVCIMVNLTNHYEETSPAEELSSPYKETTPSKLTGSSNKETTPAGFSSRYKRTTSVPLPSRSNGVASPTVKNVVMHFPSRTNSTGNSSFYRLNVRIFLPILMVNDWRLNFVPEISRNPNHLRCIRQRRPPGLFAVHLHNSQSRQEQ